MAPCLPSSHTQLPRTAYSSKLQIQLKALKAEQQLAVDLDWGVLKQLVIHLRLVLLLSRDLCTALLCIQAVDKVVAKVTAAVLKAVTAVVSDAEVTAAAAEGVTQAAQVTAAGAGSTAAGATAVTAAADTVAGVAAAGGCVPALEPWAADVAATQL
jgi:hypothetical protein